MQSKQINNGERGNNSQLVTIIHTIINHSSCQEELTINSLNNMTVLIKHHFAHKSHGFTSGSIISEHLDRPALISALASLALFLTSVVTLHTAEFEPQIQFYLQSAENNHRFLALFFLCTMIQFNEDKSRVTGVSCFFLPLLIKLFDLTDTLAPFESSRSVIDGDAFTASQMLGPTGWGGGRRSTGSSERRRSTNQSVPVTHPLLEQKYEEKLRRRAKLPLR